MAASLRSSYSCLPACALLAPALVAFAATCATALPLASVAGCGSSATPSTSAAEAGAPGGGWRAVVGAGGVFARTFDDATWQTGSAAPIDLFAVTCVGTAKAWSAGAGGVILRTQDDGVSWARQEMRLTDDLHAIRFSDDAMLGIVAGDAGALATTIDGGVTWQVRSPSTVNLHGVAVAGAAGADGLFLAVGDGGTIVHSSDHGAQWTHTPFSSASALRAVAADVSGSLILAVDSSGSVFASTDGALTFARETTAAAPLYAVYVTPDGTHGLAAGAGGTVLERDAKGAWTPATSGLTADLYGAVVTADGRAYVVGDNGAAATRSNGPWSAAPLAATAKLYAIDGR